MNPPDVDTWYVLADGTKAHPADVAFDDAGVLTHKNGVPVALRESGLPLTTGDANKENAMAAELGEPAKTGDDAKAKAAAAKANEKAQAKDREIKAAAEAAKGYQTR